MRVLAGDIGGTKVLLQIADFKDGEPQVIVEQRFESSAYLSLLSMAQEFLRSKRIDNSKAIAAACFAIAGPVTTAGDDQHAKVTNLPWQIETSTLAGALNIPKVRLINDFQAIGYGVDAISSDDFVILQRGEAVPQAPRVLIGAGTGLGQGLMVWRGDRYEAIASEGGHVDFAPTDKKQTQLLDWLRQRFEHVSYERVVSGPGLTNIYNFVSSTHGTDATPIMKMNDPAAAITTAALAGTDDVALEALTLFVKIYGAQAGNFALGCQATGGAFIAGGIAPKIIPALTDGVFIQAFTNKGRMVSLLKRMPVKIIMNPRAGLIGAAQVASQL